MWAEMNERTVPFQFQLTKEQVNAIWETAKMELIGSGVGMISKGDAIAGFLVKLMIEAGEEIERVANWVNVCRLSLSLCLQNNFQSTV